MFMLRTNKSKPGIKVSGHFAIVASEYNAKFVDSMLAGAREELTKAGAALVRIIRVPGAFEIPVVAARLARSHRPPLSAVICLGVVIRGETEHARLIGEAVTQSLAHIQVGSEIPIVHEVLLLENEKQAEVRCLDKNHNRGVEAARTAITMAGVMKHLEDWGAELDPKNDRI